LLQLKEALRLAGLKLAPGRLERSSIGLALIVKAPA